MEQNDLEILLGKVENTNPDLISTILGKSVIYFTASWCKPCKQINKLFLREEFPANWLICDIDKNEYSPGYCGVSAIPTFLLINNKKIIGKITSSNTEEVLNWLVSNDK